MIVDVFSQPHELLVLLYGGMIAGLFYELLRFGRTLLPRQTPLLDALFLLLGGFLFINSVIIGTCGVLRWYTFLGFLAGMWMSKLAFRWMFTEICKKFHKKQYPDAP